MQHLQRTQRSRRYRIGAAAYLYAALCTAGVGAIATTARADYPERQITMIVCFPAGGGTDIAARLINSQLGEALGKPVVIENRGGAGGNIGIAAAARAPADGYTLLVCSSAYVVNPSLYAQVSYDPFKDFVPIMVIGASPNAFVVPAQSDIRSMPELVARAKAAPRQLNWTSPGAGTTPYLAGELLTLRTGVQMLHIPFAGAGPATTAVLGGQVDLYTANVGSLMPLIDAGKVRPIAVLRLKLSVVMLWPKEMHAALGAPRNAATTLRAASMRRSTSREGAKLP